ncbi:hypothetical protein [Acinetobacter sp. WCHAc060025]|uniref:hypothetical protein n=1 Tax=Acinetobacter sp. WCHAc060025 TaxID=2518625 RepID=UPI001022DDFA|nr:hypothetical protein [Acinetobacter sp. WCHAc060025]RZG76932.1 hypothetical protein EXE09_05675 [Acinetobacter sp. WCHAc060025]
MSKKSYLSIFIGCLMSMNAFAETQGTPFKWQTEDGSKSLEVGGFIRANYRDERWDSDNNGKVLFDNARLNVKGKYDQFYLDTSYAFQDDHKRSIEHAFVGYKPNENNDIQAGIIYKPFAIYPFPEHAWTFQIPFFLGFADSVAPGVSWKNSSDDYDLTLAYMPIMSNGSVRYAPEAGSADDLDYVLPSQKQYLNEKRNQVNVRVAKKLNYDFGKQEFGLSGAYSQLHNKATDDDGSYYALGLHALNNYGKWDFQTSAIHYKYDAKNPAGVDDDKILMQSNGLTPAYFVASEGTIGIFNIGYTQPVTSKYFPNLKSVKFYNDYSILMKDRSDWADSQMDTFGVQFNAMPFLIWVDGSVGKNVNVLGGAKNSTGYTSANSDYSNDWKFRWNINIGYNF